MAKFNVKFSIATVYDVNRFDVVKGEKFSLHLTDTTAATDWFSNNDPVLSMRVDNYDAEVTASNVGESKIRVFDGTSIVKELVINVVEKIAEMANNLNPQASTPENK